MGDNIASLPQRRAMHKEALTKYAYRVLGRAKQNAKGRRGIEFNLAKADVDAMLLRAGWKCAVTGIEFSMEVVCGKRPYAPSIDRINSAIGYLPGNCRIVCVAANYAMNVWGEAVLKRLLKCAKVLDVQETERASA